MAYTRLTKIQRTNIVRRLMEKNEKNFDEERTKIASKQVDLAHEVYTHFLGSDYETLQSLPAKWFQKATQVRFCIGSDTYHLNFNEPGTPDSKQDRFPMPLFMAMHYGGPKLASSNPLAKRVRDLIKRERKVQDDRNKASREISFIVNAYTTAKQLVEAWPEIKGIVLGATATTKTSTVKAAKDLNLALGLA